MISDSIVRDSSLSFFPFALFSSQFGSSLLMGKFYRSIYMVQVPSGIERNILKPILFKSRERKIRDSIAFYLYLSL
ncbi:hypothetical protein BLOT_009486 [Blomia tropicalis]|nr:hypothetical protein BLOT_009486 [Blomia tropicalis]